MRSYVRESIELSNNRRLITHYTTSEFIWLSIIKFLFFLFFLWPLELTFWLIFIIVKYSFKLLILIIKLPFKLLSKNKDKNL